MILDRKNNIINTKIAKSLYQKLLGINKNEIEVLYQISSLHSETQKQDLLDFIENNNCCWDDIIKKSWDINSHVKALPINMFENLDPNKKIYDYDELKLKPEYYN